MLTLSADTLTEADCEGRVIIIEAGEANATLLDGCKSVVVTGNRVTVSVEMRAKSRTNYPGAADTVTRFPTKNGADPQIARMEPGSRVLKEQRLGCVIGPRFAVPLRSNRLPPFTFTARPTEGTMRRS